MAEQIMNTTEEAHESNIEMYEDHHTPGDTVTLFGMEITIPGGMYTVIFGVLGILTFIEIIVASNLATNSAKIVALFIIAILKAILVMAYYMHLKDDQRIFLAVLFVPLLVTLLSVLYLVVVPPVGYSM